MTASDIPSQGGQQTLGALPNPLGCACLSVCSFGPFPAAMLSPDGTRVQSMLAEVFAALGSLRTGLRSQRRYLPVAVCPYVRGGCACVRLSPRPVVSSCLGVECSAWPVVRACVGVRALLLVGTHC